MKNERRIFEKHPRLASSTRALTEQRITQMIRLAELSSCCLMNMWLRSIGRCICSRFIDLFALCLRLAESHSEGTAFVWYAVTVVTSFPGFCECSDLQKLMEHLLALRRLIKHNLRQQRRSQRHKMLKDKKETCRKKTFFSPCLLFYWGVAYVRH